MKCIVILLTLLLILTSCSSGETATDDISDATKASEMIDSADMFFDADNNTEYTDGVTIELDGNTATATSNSVKCEEGMVTITEEADYYISGNFDGMIVVDANEKAEPHIIFDSVEITSESTAALYVLEADKVVVTLKGENSLSNGGSFEAIDENDIDAVVFSKQDITFNGEGNLTVDSPAGHGIVSKDDLIFAGGSYYVNSASHGIDANDSVRCTDSSFYIDSGKDGIRAENNDDVTLGYVYIENGNFEIEAEGDGISAGAYMQIADGSFNITSGGGAENASQQSSQYWGGYMGGYSSSGSTEDSTSIKGIKAATELLIGGGEFNIDSADDAIHSNTAITVNGGVFELKSGDDGIHADDTLVIEAGTVSINESYEGLEAFDITVNGGDISIYASDDGINAAGGNDESGYGGFRGNDMFGGGIGMDNGGSITINGGSMYINASGDGLDSNGTLKINGGDITVSGPTYGDTATLDYATEGSIHGGNFVGTGGNAMNVCFDSSSTQGVIMVSASGEANTTIILTDADGNIILEHTPDQAFSCVILSSAEIKEGESYTLKVGNYETEITMSSTVYSTGGMGGFGGGMGGPGMGGPGMGGGRPGGRW